MDKASKKGNFVCFSAKYLPSLGGVEFFTHNLCLEMAREGFDVIIACTEPAADDDAPLKIDGPGSLRILRLDSWGWRRVPFIRWNAHSRACIAEIMRSRPDYALIQTRFYGFSRTAARLMNKIGVTPVLIDHGTGHIALPNAALSKAIEWAEHLLTALLKRYRIDFYGVSNGASQWLGHFGINSCGQINNAIDADSFVASSSGRDFRSEHGIDTSTLCVAFASRLVENKGADVIVDAARKLSGDRRIHFFVAGSGEMEDVLVAADAQLGNLTYTGRLDHPDLASLLLASDVFCFPTKYAEGMPTSLLEAAACKTALMTTACGGVDVIVPTPAHGIVLPSADADEVIRELRALADDADRLECLKQTAAAHVRARFSWEHTAKQAIAAFTRANA